MNLMLGFLLLVLVRRLLPDRVMQLAGLLLHLFVQAGQDVVHVVVVGDAVRHHSDDCMAKRIDSTNPPTNWKIQPLQEVLC